jgi:putative ABC transport system ATP-binding protein
MQATGLDHDAFDWGVRRAASGLSEDVHTLLLRARAQLRQALDETHLADAIESFNPDGFVENASLLENILFGAINDDAKLHLIESHVLQCADQAGLSPTLIQQGRKVAELMIEMFRDLDPADMFFQSFNFISPEEMGEYERLLRRQLTRTSTAHDDSDRLKLLQLALKLVPAKHPSATDVTPRDQHQQQQGNTHNPAIR